MFSCAHMFLSYLTILIVFITLKWKVMNYIFIVAEGGFQHILTVVIMAWQSELSYLVWVCMFWGKRFTSSHTACVPVSKLQKAGCLSVEIWQQKLGWTSVSWLLACDSTVALCSHRTWALVKAVESTWLRLQAKTYLHNFDTNPNAGCRIAVFHLNVTKCFLFPLNLNHWACSVDYSLCKWPLHN